MFRTAVSLFVMIAALALGMPASAQAQGSVQSLEISSVDGGVLARNATRQFSATAVFEDGSTGDVTGQVVWASSNSSAISIDSSGKATALGGGVSNITASMDAVTSNTVRVVSSVCTFYGGPGDDTITGTAGADYLCGNGGNDVIDGLDGMDILVGGAGVDTISGGGDADLIYGHGAADVIQGGGGVDLIFGGDGDDDIVGGDEGDIVFGNDGDDDLQGGSGDDRLQGDAGNDTLAGSTGADRLLPGVGSDTLDGGDQHDSANFFDSVSGVTVDVVAGTAGEGPESDSLAGIETFFGSPHDDKFSGGADVDVFLGQGGDDIADGAGSADRLIGGAGIDTLRGDAGADLVMGEADADVVDGGEGNDRLFGGAAGDEVIGGSGADELRGEGGDDALAGGDDNDFVFPGEGNDNAQGDGGINALSYADVSGPVSLDMQAGTASGAGNDVLSGFATAYGTAADDVMAAADAGSVLVGGSGADTLNGSAGGDTLRGGPGDDQIFGNGGQDWIAGNEDHDTVQGGDDGDRIFGDGGNDVLNGNAGNDAVYGRDGADSVAGGSENDQLFGESGADSLYGDTGNDALTPGGEDDPVVDGGDGDDIVMYSGATSGVTVNLSTATTGGAAGNDGLQNVENAHGSQHDDVLTGDATPNRLVGTAGVDTITGGDQADRLYGGAGNDPLDGGAGNDLVHGAGGDDTLLGGADNDYIEGHDGIDTVDAGTGDDKIFPGIGNETSLDGGDGTDLVSYHLLAGAVTLDLAAGQATGGSGNDLFTNMEDGQGGDGDDTIFGTDGPNNLWGDGGSDTISGRGGVDVIKGRAGDDFLRGGPGDVDEILGDDGTDTCGEAGDTRTGCELAFNEPPILSIVDNTNTYTEGAAATAVDSTLTLTDDEANTDGATVTIGTGYEPGEDILSVSESLPAGVTVSYVAPTLTISGTATVAQYQAILRSVKFENTSQNPDTTNRTITFTVTDGEETDTDTNDVTMGVLRVNDPPVADTDSYSGGNHGIRLRVGTTHADTHEVEISGNVLDGDVDVDTPTANLTTTPGTITSTDCAAANPACANNVTMASDGTFTYDPPAGGDTSDTFTYTVEDNDTGDSDGTEDTHTNTVTVGMSGTRAWFVDDDAQAGGRGVSHAPLQSLAQLATGGNLNEEDGAGDRILVYSGTYTTGIDLEAGQWILGEPHGLNIGGTQFVAAGGSRPAMSSAAGNIVTLHSGTQEVQDLNLGNAPAGSYSLHAPTGSGAFTVADTDIANGTGGALHIADGTPTVTLGTLSSTGSTNHGVRIAETEGGTVSSTGGTLSNSTLADFATSNSHTTVTLASAISDDVGQLVNVSGGSGDVTYNGAITDLEDGDGDGIAIVNTSGDHNFTKSVLMSVSPTKNAFDWSNASAGGSLRMVPSSGVNRLASTTGTALNVTNTTIHSDGIKFERINSQGLSKYGINLQNTGVNNGRLEISGTGSAATGGTISGKNDGVDAASGPLDTSPSAGIYIENGRGPSLAWMKMSNFGDFAIKGQTVNGFNMANTVIDGSLGNVGNNSATDEGAVSFDELSGTGVAITNSTIQQWFENGVRIRNDSGNLNRITITGSTLGSTLAESTDAVQLDSHGSSILNATIGAVGSGNTFTGTEGEHVNAYTQGTSSGDIVVAGNTMTQNHPTPIGNAINLGASGSGDQTYNISNNTISGAEITAVAATASFASGLRDATAVGTISGNTIGTSGVAGSGSEQASGMDLSLIGDGRHSVTVANNTIRQVSQRGIIAFAGGSSRNTTGGFNNGDLNVTMTNNLVEQPYNSGSSSSGFWLNAGSNADGGPDQYDVCLTFINNNMANAGEEMSSNSRDYVFQQGYETKVLMPGWPGPNASQVAGFAAALTAYADGRDAGGIAATAAGSTLPTDYTANTADDGFFNTAGGANCSTS